MSYVFRIGPVETTEGDAFIYFIDSGDEDSPPPVMAASDDQALRQIAAEHLPGDESPGVELNCAPNLEQAGREHGLVPLAPDQMQGHRMGLVAFDMALGDELGELESTGVLYQLGVACGKLWQAKPWEKSFSERALRVELSGSVEAVWDLAVFGGEGEDCGLTLYPEAGLFAKIQALAEKGEVEEAARLGSLGVSLELEPPWAEDIFSTVYGVPRLPHPLKVADGERAYVDDTDLVVLAATLQAMAVLEEGDPGATGDVRVGDVGVLAHVLV